MSKASPVTNPLQTQTKGIRRASWKVRLFLCFVLLTVINPFVLAQAAPKSQTLSAQEQAQALLERMTPEEKVGQLFLVTFPGTDVSGESQIYDLIFNHHIGGVILLSSNGNLLTGDNALSGVLDMNRRLQVIRWEASQQSRVNPSTSENFNVNFVPLFIGISQEGDGYPYDQILTGLSPLPNQMAMGATWNPDLTSQVGNVLGRELSALGFNLLLGPSLDVLERPRPEDANDLGTRTFGGDPFWVGEMGSAFISGVHQGSQNQIAVIAKHFPGNGGADRTPEEEVATVRKNLEELKNFDLAPFFKVTGQAESMEATADGLLAAHIRYQGFEENIRDTTRPVSFDPQWFSQLMSLPHLSTWRENGGVMVSDNLGSRAVRRYYELTNPNQHFDAYRMAKNAFLAGNDLLYLGDVTSGEDPDAYTTIVRILELFTQQYREDAYFAEDVDEKVLRILALKYRMFPNYSLREIVPESEELGDLGKSGQVNFEIARQAATLISPTLMELDSAIPDPPNQYDRLVFLTDSRLARQCSQCPEQPVFEVNALEQAVVRLYGPQGGSQVLPTNLTSYSLEDLLVMLDSERDTTQIETDLHRAHWIVVSMLNVTSEIPSSQALPRFLAERPDIFQGKRLIVFAFNAPFYLDATNISKVTAYYGMYSKGPSFVEVAARLLFRELRPEGALPVSVPGVGYDLISATSPDPNQIIPLYLDLPGFEVPGNSSTPQPTTVPTYQMGDLIPVHTGVIYDHNGNPVPDGTTVQFIFTVNGELSAPPVLKGTEGGVATTTIQVTNPGTWEIRAESEPARQSTAIRFNVPALNEPTVTITPTMMPTATPSPTATPTLPPPVITTPEPPPPRPNLTDWFMALFLTAIVGVASYRMAATIGYVRWGVRGGFLALIGGLLAYTYLAIGMPGSESLFENLGAFAVVFITLFGCALGVAATWGWRAVQLASSKPGEIKNQS